MPVRLEQYRRPVVCTGYILLHEVDRLFGHALIHLFTVKIIGM